MSTLEPLCMDFMLTDVFGLVWLARLVFGCLYGVNVSLHQYRIQFCIKNCQGEKRFFASWHPTCEFQDCQVVFTLGSSIALLVGGAN